MIPRGPHEQERAGGRSVSDAEETRTSTTSTTALSVPECNHLIVTSASLRQAARLVVLQTEIELLGQAELRAPLKGVSRPRQRTLDRSAPFGIVRRTKAARFRLPRALKQRLMDDFCADSAARACLPKTAIIVAHPDDESIGAGSRLFRLDNAYVVHVTDGAPKDPEAPGRYGFASREEYAAARRAEVERALALAGVPSNRIIGLDYVDGEASLHLVEICLKVAELLDQLRPAVVITHPYEGGHTDHDATAFAVHMACGILLREGVPVPAVLELTSYHSRSGVRTAHEFLPHKGADTELRVILLAHEYRAKKQQMYEAFTSQTQIVSTFSTAVEKFRPAPRYVFTRAPHAGILNYEQYPKGLNGDAWRLQALEALRKLGMRGSKSLA